MSEQFEVARVDKTIREHDDKPDEPLIHCFGYNNDGKFKHATVEGFEPYFYVAYEEIPDPGWIEKSKHIKRVEYNKLDGSSFLSARRHRVAKVVTYVPGDVAEARDNFENHYESDVLFPQRFITDLAIKSGINVPTTDEPVHVSDVDAVDLSCEWRIHYTDIEVDDRAGFPENGEQPILCITAYDSFEKEYITWIQGEGKDTEYMDSSTLHDADVDVRYYDSEADMLRSYFAYLRATRPAVFTAWNVDFDAEYLVDRARVLSREQDEEVGLESISPLQSVSNHDYFGVRVKGMVVFDLLDAFKSTKFTELESYRLDYVADQFVGDSKETYVGTIGDLWEDDPGALVDYNIRDVELVVEINREQEIIPFWKEVKSIVACQLGDAITESTAADRYILSEYNGQIVFPNQGSADETGDSFSGGAVFEPISGIREWVSTLDLASLYPMSMLTLNASPETKVDPEEFDGETVHSPNGIYFRQDEDGLTRQLITDLLERRNKKKEQRDACDPDSDEYDVYDRQQRALKVLMNSLYGILSWSNFRLYDQDVGAAVTATGRAVINHTDDVVQSAGYDVLYGDTDSVLIDLSDVTFDDPEITEELRDKCSERGDAELRRIQAILNTSHDLEVLINNSYDDFAKTELNADEHWFDIEFEKLYERYFQAGKKKRYAGSILWNEGKFVDYVDVTGFEYVRSDVSAFASEAQKNVIDRIVSGADRNDVVSFVEGLLDDWEERRVNIGKIGVPQGIGKQLNDYDIETDTVRSAKFGNLLLGTTFTEGSSPKRYYLDDVNPALFDRLEESEGLDPVRDRMYAEFKNDPWIVAVDRPEKLVGELVLDWEKMREKNLKQSLSGIMQALDFDWEELLSDSRQTGLHSYT